MGERTKKLKSKPLFGIYVKCMCDFHRRSAQVSEILSGRRGNKIRKKIKEKNPKRLKGKDQKRAKARARRLFQKEKEEKLNQKYKRIRTKRKRGKIGRIRTKRKIEKGTEEGKGKEDRDRPAQFLPNVLPRL